MKCSRFLRCVAALSLCLCVLFSSSHYALADDISKSLVVSGNDLTIITYNLSDYGSRFDTTVSDASLATKYTTFRMWIYFDEVIPKGSTVDVSLVMHSGVGSLGSIYGYFASQSGGGCYESALYSSSVELSYAGAGKVSYFENSFYVTHDTSSMFLNVNYTSRTSTSIYLDCSKVILNYTCPEPVVSELEDLNDKTDNIFTKISNLPSNIANSISGFFTSLGTSINNKLQTLYNSLPTAIKDKLESLFTGIQTATNNVKTAVSDIGTNIVTAVTSLPANIKTQLTSLFTNVSSAVDNVKTGVVNLPSNISGFFTNLGTSVGGFIDSGVERILTGIKGFFLPSRESLLTYIDKWKTLLNERFTGFVECRDMVLSYYDVFLSYKESSTVFFPKTEIPLLGYTFPFGGWEVRLVPEGFEPILGYAKWIASAVCTLLFVNVMHVKFDKFLGVLT